MVGIDLKNFLLLFILVVSLDGRCWGKDCAYRSPQVQQQTPRLADLREPIDDQIQRSYWYYLVGANLMYQGYGDLPDRYLFLYIYRNMMGTFLAIASWDKNTKLSQISTFVRLGNGYHKQPKSKVSPFSVEPFIISLRLSEEETLIELDQRGSLSVNGQQITFSSIDQQQISSCRAATDKYLRKTYWYYIRGADLIKQQTMSTNRHNYFTFTYINIAGTFLVIATCDTDQSINVNTFVRLGPGGRPSEPLAPINSNL